MSFVTRSFCALVVLCGVLTAHAEAATLTVNAGGDLQAAINTARPGDTILLAAGATFTGSFTLPAKNGTSYITIRSSAPDTALPPAGVRITPDFAAQLPKIRSTSTGAAFRTSAGSSYWRLQFLEIFPSSSTASADLVQFGSGGSSQNTLSVVPHHLVLDRAYLHGDPTYGQRRGVSLNSRDSEVTNSYFADFKSTSFDTQAICGWNGPGPFVIENNYLEAAAENVMFGGTDPYIPNLTPTGITIRRNTISKPKAWMTQGWTIKNLVELKNAADVTIDGNTLENSWLANQQGYAIMMSPRNQSGTAPWSGVRNVTISNNVIRHVAAGMNITGYDNLATAQQTQGISVVNNLFWDVSSTWSKNPSTSPAAGRAIFIGAGPKDIEITHNTMVTTGSAVFIDGGYSPTGVQVTGFVFNDNIVHAGKYPIYGNAQGEGTKGLNFYTPLYQFLGNVIGKTSTVAYPSGTDMVDLALLEQQFVDYAHGDFRLTTSNTLPAHVGVDFAALTAASAGVVTAPPPDPAPTPTPPPTPTTTPPVSTPYGGTRASLPGTLQLENYDVGGEGLAYHDSTSGNTGAVYRKDDVDIQAASDTGGGYNLGWTRSGEWLAYSATVTAAGTYTIDVRVASSGAGGTFHVEVNGVDKTGPMTVPNTGGWQIWTTISKTGVALTAGPQIVRLVFDSPGPGSAIAKFNWLKVR
jgi:hypothetical protein